MPLAAISLVSAAAIAFEVLLVWLYAIVQWHHFAFMIISVALLGYGASGTFIALARRWLLARYTAAWQVNAALFGLTSVLAFALIQRIPFNPLAVVWEPAQLLGVALTYLILMVPFFFAANCVGAHHQDQGQVLFEGKEVRFSSPRDASEAGELTGLWSR